MDIVTSEYERVTSILFHAFPDLIKKLDTIFLTEYWDTAKTTTYVDATSSSSLLSTAPGGDVGQGDEDPDPCVVFLDDYFQHRALLDIQLAPCPLSVSSLRAAAAHQSEGRCYGEGSQVISRRRVISDILEMVLEFFAVTGQTDSAAPTCESPDRTLVSCCLSALMYHFLPSVFYL